MQAAGKNASQRPSRSRGCPYEQIDGARFGSKVEVAHQCVTVVVLQGSHVQFHGGPLRRGSVVELVWGSVRGLSWGRTNCQDMEAGIRGCVAEHPSTVSGLPSSSQWPKGVFGGDLSLRVICDTR